MARKSRQLRLEQAKELASLYEEAGFAGIKKHRFIRDMVARLEVRDITGGQKKFLDSLIEQGAPEVKNQERVAEIEAAMEVDGMQHRREPLESFARSLRGGWDLSEKQEKFLATLLAESKRLAVEGRYRPTNETISDLRIAIKKVQGSGGWYLSHRPGTAKAFETVRRWIQWFDEDSFNKKVLADLEATGRAQLTDRIKSVVSNEPHIDEWNVNKLLNAAKKTLEELKNPKHLPGELRYYRGSEVALISGAPTFKAGEVVYPAIVNGNMVETHMLTKRRTRRN